MATVKDKLDTIEAGTNYIGGSLFFKSGDIFGCVYKWLEENTSGGADRKEIFFELDPKEANLSFSEKTAVSDIMVNNPT